jgi:hypothetical protein
MSTISMVLPGFGGNGNVSLRGGSQSYTATNGVVQVAPVDVPIAIASGWTLHAGSAAQYAAAQVRAMAAPATFVGSTVTLPDQTTATITAGIAQIPATWVNFMTEEGWRLVGALAGA